MQSGPHLPPVPLSVLQGRKPPGGASKSLTGRMGVINSDSHVILIFSRPSENIPAGKTLFGRHQKTWFIWVHPSLELITRVEMKWTEKNI